MPAIKRRIILCYQGENHIYYRTASSDYGATILAIHALEQDKGMMFGGLVPHFRDKRDKNLFDSNKVEVQLV